MEKEGARYLDSLECSMGPCWNIRHCPDEWKEQCSAWQYQAGGSCWEVDGTFCQGRVRRNPREKRVLCSECDVFQSTLVKPKG